MTRRLSSFLVACGLALAATGSLPSASGPVPEAALALRNLGIAQLENEQPDQAEATFRRLAEAVPNDPLPVADLAVALLRQQKNEEALAAIDRALAKAPGRADLLAIRGDVFQWSNKPEEALAAYQKASAADPDRVDLQYVIYRQAANGVNDAVLAAALDALVRLRPENLVVMLQSGQRAVRTGNRAGATQAFLRVRELLWQPQPAVSAALDAVLKALEGGDLAAVRSPAARLENVLRPSPLYQAGLRELSLGLQGTPVERFDGEPPATTFGDPIAVRFRAASLAAEPLAGSALAAGDFDGDERADLVRVVAGESPKLEIRLAAGSWNAKGISDAAGITGLLAVDLDNDGRLDLIGFGKRTAFWRGKGDGTFTDATAEAGLSAAGEGSAAAFDFDLEGDLDLVTAGAVFRNALSGPLEKLGGDPIPAPAIAGARQLVASDLDRDGDIDLAAATSKGIVWLDNTRQGRFLDRTAAAGLSSAGPVEAIASADLDNDGWPDLIAAGTELSVWHNRRGRFLPLPRSGGGPGRGLGSAGSEDPSPTLPALARGEGGLRSPLSSVLAFDADNDGRLDLAAAGPRGISILGQRGQPEAPVFEPLALEGAPAAASALAAADLDGDGDLDLVAAGPAGLHRLENLDGNRNHWLDVRLRALTQGSGKNNLHGLGATLEVRSGSAYQFREVAGTVTHLGLGRRTQADLLRVLWTNGVPQNRIQPRGDERIVEEQVLKGSCPFLYVWDGRGFSFVTDLLWNAPLGLPVAPGVWAGSDSEELVRADGALPENGSYRLRVTEELWEAAFFDAVRLWVVDHPAEVEVASTLKVVPGQPPSREPDRVLGSRAVRPVAAAWDGRGEDVTERVRERDDIYASGYPIGPYQGVAAAPWSFTFDLGEAPGRPVRLLLDSWIFPADASLNLGAAQRRDLEYVPPRLEVETAAGWQTLIPTLGHPAGKTKTMVIDTPPLPEGARRLRIVSTLWLSWDRVAWTAEPDDAVPIVRARLSPVQADLRYRGFSALLRQSPDGPHSYDYSRTTRQSPWLPMPGRYTRYGDVRELLGEADDRTVILAAGDEIDLAFDASGLPPVPAGWRRTVFLESHGWDKDADRNTWEAKTMEPLPFRAMSGYPYGPGETYPDTPELREYQTQWLTREVDDGQPPPGGQ